MQKREKIMMGAAGGAALFFVVNQFLCAEPAKPRPMAPAAAAVSAPEKTETKRSRSSGSRTVAPANRSPRLLREGGKPLARFAGWRRNPFEGAILFMTMPSDTTAEADKLQLQGIAWKKGEALALIGNAILRDGESAGNLEILEIREDRVLCRIDGELVTLMLRADDVNDPKN